MSTYGYFDDKHREYVITRPDTPLPWLNMLGQDDFFGICTQTAAATPSGRMRAFGVSRVIATTATRWTMTAASCT